MKSQSSSPPPLLPGHPGSLLPPGGLGWLPSAPAPGMAMKDQDLMMFLACMFSMNLFASCLEFSRAKPPYFDRHKSLEEDNEVSTAPEDLGNEGGSSEEEETSNRVRRAVRKYPEEAEDTEYRHHGHMEMEHRHDSLRHHGCDCPDMLAKGTLIVIVATLAFLIIFSSSIQLVVAVCILRLVKKQRKMEKDTKPRSHSSHHRKHHPPAPPPRPETTYMTMKGQGYERLQLASPRAKQGVYLNASELHPGPRLSQEKRYQNMGGSPQVPKNEGSPEAVASPKKRETHLYEEVE